MQLKSFTWCAALLKYIEVACCPVEIFQVVCCAFEIFARVAVNRPP